MKLKIEARREVESRKASSAWDGGSSQRVLTLLPQLSREIKVLLKSSK